MRKYGLSAKGVEKQVKLNKLHVSGNVCGEYIEYTIAQHYRNENKEEVNCTYSFPVPDTATLTGLSISLGGKNLTGSVESRDEVIKILENAKGEGLNPIKLESDEEDSFQISIGNVLPMEKIIIKITYMDQLIYDDNLIKVIIPSVVGPTYTIGEKEQEIGQASDFYLSLMVESFGEVSAKSTSHKIKVERQQETLRKITIDKGQTLDRDFVLVLEEKKPRQADGIAYSYYDSEKEMDKAILMLRFFPVLPGNGQRGPKNYSFIIDTSLSMEGKKLEQSQNAVLIALRSLEEGDKFNVITFNSEVATFASGGKVKYTRDNLEAATEWIENQPVRDGTNIFGALKEALREAELEEEPSYIFLFSDDMVENENEILDYIKTNIGDSRIFPIGLDTEVNSYFINKLAEVGYGMSDFIEVGQRVDDIILRQFNRIHNPQMDVTAIDWGQMQIERTYPGTISYLYDREPFTIFAEVTGWIEGKVTVKGMVGDKKHKLTADLDKLEIEENSKLIEKVWARKMIESLEEKESTLRDHEKEQVRERILELSKAYNMLSSETAFIMIESIEDPVSGYAMNRIVPVDMDEDTMRNLSESFFLDDTRYSDDLNIREKMAETGISRDEAAIAIKFDRENLLRILARNQQADGAFKDIAEGDPAEILETTLKGLLAFNIGNEPVTIYINNIHKAFNYVMNAITEHEDLLTERNLMLLSIASKLADGKRLIQDKTKVKLDSLFDNVKQGVYSDSLKAVESVVENTSAIQMKYIMAAALNISSSLVKYAEEILELDVKTNINKLAEVALAKAL